MMDTPAIDKAVFEAFTEAALAEMTPAKAASPEAASAKTTAPRYATATSDTTSTAQFRLVLDLGGAGRNIDDRHGKRLCSADRYRSLRRRTEGEKGECTSESESNSVHVYYLLN
ncbi:MAG: hypothetical protein AAFX04_11385 [Pseudomonadota bacterium]